MNRRILLVLLCIVLSTIACYCGATVNESQRGIVLDGGRITRVEGPGYYNEINPLIELQYINVSTLNVDWTDTSVVTGDRQPISLSLNISFQRPRDATSLTTLWQNYNTEAKEDEPLRSRVLSMVANPAKSATVQFTIWQMLGIEEIADINPVATSLGIESSRLTGVEGRQLLSTVIQIMLEREMANQGLPIEVTGVVIVDVTPSPEFMDLLNRSANAEQERQVVIVERQTNNERLASERVQTQIELELASREQQVNELRAQSYVTSPALLQIRLAEIYSEAIDRGDVVIYVPPGSSISDVLGQSGIIDFPMIQTLLEQMLADESAASMPTPEMTDEPSAGQ